MQISDQHLDEFIELYRKNLGITIDRATALEKGMKLVRLMQITYQSPIQKNMRSIQRRFNNFQSKNPKMSSYINFAKAVKVQRFTREIIARWFNKLVERDDYDRGDKRSILARLTELSNPIEDNDKQAQTASPLQD